MSERRARSLIPTDRKMIRCRSKRPPEAELRARQRDLANQRRWFVSTALAPGRNSEDPGYVVSFPRGKGTHSIVCTLPMKHPRERCHSCRRQAHGVHFVFQKCVEGDRHPSFHNL